MLGGWDVARGGDLFRLNCASSHNFTGKGGRAIHCEITSKPLGRVIAELGRLPAPLRYADLPLYPHPFP